MQILYESWFQISKLHKSKNILVLKSSLVFGNDNATFLDLYCYACGLPEIDPEVDTPGSFGDARQKWTSSDKKMYNMSCDIAEQMGLDEKWLRKCPHGVKSCFWSKSSYAMHGK